MQKLYILEKCKFYISPSIYVNLECKFFQKCKSMENVNLQFSQTQGTGTTSTKFTRIMKTLILAAEKRPVFLKERHPTLSSWPPRTSPKSASHGCLDTQVLILCLSEFQDRSHSFTQIAQLISTQWNSMHFSAYLFRSENMVSSSFFHHPQQAAHGFICQKVHKRCYNDGNLD